jgi:hypothetical protein
MPSLDQADNPCPDLGIGNILFSQGKSRSPEKFKKLNKVVFI